LSILECNQYINAQKHLDEEMKDKVPLFFNCIWDERKAEMYYSSNFDHESIISVIAESEYRGAE
jgi:hypothetical protein